MPDISKVQLPSGGIYDIKDQTARDLISGGINFDIVWTQADFISGTAPTAERLASIPAGVVVQYNSGSGTATGTLVASADTKAIFKLIYSATQTSGSTLDKYDEYVTVPSGNSFIWEKIGDTQVDLSDVVRSITVTNNGNALTPDADGNVNIYSEVAALVYNILDNFTGTIFGLDVSGNTAALKQISSSGFGAGVSFENLRINWTDLASQPLRIVQPVSTNVYRIFEVIGLDATTNTAKLLCIENGTRYEAELTANDNASPLTGTFVATSISSDVTLDKDTDNVLGEGTTFALTSGAVSHGALTGHTDNVLGADTTFNVTNPTINLGGTTKYLSATASDGGVTWNSKDQKTVVTGYASPTTGSFVPSVSVEKNKKLVTTSITPVGGTADVVKTVSDNTKKLATTSIPNVTGNTDVSVPNITANTSVSIPNVTGNTNVSIPNVTSAGSASTWTFQMGTGDASETLIISGANSVAPTLGAALSASKVTLGDNLTATNTTLGTANTASKVTLGTAITAATGALTTTGTGADVMISTSTTPETVALSGTATTVATGGATTSGSGAVVVTDVTPAETVEAITALGTPSTTTVVGTSSTFTNTQPTITLTANAASGTGTVTYLESANPTATGGSVTPVTSGTGADVVAAVTSMPTSTVNTGITVGTNDIVEVLTSDTDITSA